MDKLLTNLEALPFGPGEVSVVGGHFDLIHPGHIRFLKECKRQAEGPLVVFLANDKASAKKKNGRPIMSENDRAEMLMALECVDYVYIFPTKIDEMPRMLELISPQKIFFSIDPHPSRFTLELIKLLEEELPHIQVVHVPRQRSDISTTQIIEKIVSTGKPVPKNTKTLENTEDIKQYLIELSEQSKRSLKVTTVLLNEVTGEVLSTGHNSVAEVDNDQVIHRKEGTPEHLIQGPRAHHAEIEAICDFINQGNSNFANVTLFSKVEPCAGCAQMITRLGIKKVRYFEDFDNNYGTLILNKAGVNVEKI